MRRRVALLACPAVGLCSVVFSMQPLKRKQIKHFHEPGHLHELTFSCYRQMPLLVDDVWRGMLAEGIQRATEIHQYRLIAFVFMPEHVHLLVLPERTASTISVLLNAIKRPFWYRVKKLLMKTDAELLSQLTVQQRPGDMTFRYWQEGPGYDRNLTEPAAIKASIQYIHANPVKRGLCLRPEEWRWSSARRFAFPESPADPLLPLVKALPPEFGISGA